MSMQYDLIQDFSTRQIISEHGGLDSTGSVGLLILRSPGAPLGDQSSWQVPGNGLEIVVDLDAATAGPF